MISYRGNLTFGGDDLRAVADVDVVGTGDLVDQLLRHRGGHRVAAYYQGHLTRVAGEVDGGLPGGVGATSDVDLPSCYGWRFRGGGGAVVDTGAAQ